MSKPRNVILGKRFGRLVVVEEIPPRGSKERWMSFCKCDCGGTITASNTNLVQGGTTSCGCFKRETMERLGKEKRKVEIGQKINKLTVLERLVELRGSNHKKKVYFICQCECGKIKKMPSEGLAKKKTISCGCYFFDSKPLCALPIQEQVQRYTFCAYRKSARTRDLAFSLTEKDVGDLVFSNCAYCGTPPDHTNKVHSSARMKGKEVPKINGIDRIDNSQGYTRENCVPCCTKCNYAKGEMDAKSFKEWIVRLVRGFEKKKGSSQ